MIDIDLQIQSEPEPEGYELGYYTFNLLPALEVTNVETTKKKSAETQDQDDKDSWKLPISNDTLSKLQQKDDFCKNIFSQIEKGNLIERQLYLIRNNILKRYIIDGDHTYETIVIPRTLTPQILQMAHDELGHNGTHRTYILLKRLHHWKGLKPSVEKHIKMCYQCKRRNRQVVKYATLHFDIATFPMQFISMDLAGEFHLPTSRKHRYALTVICMLTGYVFCVPLKTKTAEEVNQADIDNVY